MLLHLKSQNPSMRLSEDLLYTFQKAKKYPSYQPLGLRGCHQCVWQDREVGEGQVFIDLHRFSRRWGHQVPGDPLRGAQHNWRAGLDHRTPLIPSDGPGHTEPVSWREESFQGAVSLSCTLFLQLLVLSMKKYLLHPIVTPITGQSLNGAGHLRLS